MKTKTKKIDRDAFDAVMKALRLIEGAMSQAKEVKGTDRYSMEFTAQALNAMRELIEEMSKA